MSKQDKVYARTPSDLERKYNFGKTFGEVYGLISDAQKAVETAINAVNDMDKKFDSEEIFNRLTNNGAVQGIYRGEDDEIYINASYIKSGKIAAEFIDAEKLTVNAANVTGLLAADRIKLGGNMTIYESVDSYSSVGSIGYTYLNGTTNEGISFGGNSLGIISNAHAMLMAPSGNLIMVGLGTVMLASSSGDVRISGRELRFNGYAIFDRLTAFETAFNAMGYTFNWANDG